MQGNVVYFELPADNIERAKEFYEKAFGWKVNHNTGLDYHFVSTAPADERGRATTPGTINGGMPKRKSPSSPKSTVVTIDVSDIDSTLKTVEKLGGKTIRKFEVPSAGYAAYFRDTEGNVVGLFQSTRTV